MLKSFLLKGEHVPTISVYINMLRNGMFPDNYTLPYVLKACANLKSDFLGKALHGQCLKLGFVTDVYVGNTLIWMYALFGNMEVARDMFDESPSKSSVLWTVMISGYAKIGDVDNARLFFDDAPVKDIEVWGSMISAYVQNNCFKEGLHMFRLLQSTELELDEAIFVSALCACANLGALDIGVWIHRYIEHGHLSMSMRLGTALIDMYAKCGNLGVAKALFGKILQKDVVCWNVMISGLAMNGDGVGTLQLFSEMEKTGIVPDDITFVGIFAACSYSGMANEGLEMLDKMCSKYLIEPKREHYSCIIDILGRAGLLEKAMEIIQRLPNSRSPSSEAIAWRALMSACCDHGEAKLAEAAAERLFELERHSGAYVLLSNLYSAAGKYDDARRIRRVMRNREVDKTPGCSSIEINGSVHEFVAGEQTHPNMDKVHSILKQMTRNLDFSGRETDPV
ncbi:Pentatricopeptide repeat [Dillenia turbinata]|uniref:Pentatricopeptide repeat n=1 Tax=Dillenia turbinata TaxID=194707 RepID=A0AAN8VGM0_9MAGN